MNHLPVIFTALLLATLVASAAESNGLAPEVADLSPKSLGWAAEGTLPDLEKPFITTAPADMKDGLAVGTLENKEGILKFADEIAAGQEENIDSLLLVQHGKLVFESYYRRGRVNYPHFQMSITKSYTAMAIGRAIQLGYLKMSDLDRPVVSFLKDIDQSKLAPGAAAITLAEAMDMHSGVRLEEGKTKEFLKQPAALKGQGQIQVYLENSAPVPPSPREFKYQESDPSMTMQVLETVVPGGAQAFIAKELLGKMGITNYSWETDSSGLPKAAAGAGMRSRDMVKWGLLILNHGQWSGEQLIPAEYIEKATSKIYTNPQQISYGYFFWRHDMEVGGKKYDCKSCRGAGGQFILMLPELDLLAVITAHDKGMGNMLRMFPQEVLPAFIAN